MRARLWFWTKFVAALVSIVYGASIMYFHYAYGGVVRNMLSIETGEPATAIDAFRALR